MLESLFIVFAPFFSFSHRLLSPSGPYHNSASAPSVSPIYWPNPSVFLIASSAESRQPTAEARSSDSCCWFCSRSTRQGQKNVSAPQRTRRAQRPEEKREPRREYW